MGRVGRRSASRGVILENIWETSSPPVTIARTYDYDLLEMCLIQIVEMHITGSMEAWGDYWKRNREEIKAYCQAKFLTRCHPARSKLPRHEIRTNGAAAWYDCFALCQQYHYYHEGGRLYGAIHSAFLISLFHRRVLKHRRYATHLQLYHQEIFMLKSNRSE